MAEKEYRVAKRRIEVTYDDPDGHLYLYVKKTLYGLSDNDWEDLTELLDGGTVSNPLVEQVYHGIIYDAAIQMAATMVADAKYRKEIIESLRAAYTQMKNIVNQGAQMSFQEKHQFSNAIDGLDRCIPMVDCCFTEPVNVEDQENVVFYLANVLYLIHNKYYSWFELDGYKEIE